MPQALLNGSYINVGEINALALNVPYALNLPYINVGKDPYLVTFCTEPPVNIKATCYQSMVRSILDYASIVWSPYKQKNIQALESVQKRSARFVFNYYSPYDSVSDMHTH